MCAAPAAARRNENDPELATSLFQETRCGWSFGHSRAPSPENVSPGDLDVIRKRRQSMSPDGPAAVGVGVAIGIGIVRRNAELIRFPKSPARPFDLDSDSERNETSAGKK